MPSQNKSNSKKRKIPAAFTHSPQATSATSSADAPSQVPFPGWTSATPGSSSRPSRPLPSRSRDAVPAIPTAPPIPYRFPQQPQAPSLSANIGIPGSSGQSGGGYGGRWESPQGNPFDFRDVSVTFRGDQGYQFRGAASGAPNPNIPSTLFRPPGLPFPVSSGYQSPAASTSDGSSTVRPVDRPRNGDSHTGAASHASSGPSPVTPHSVGTPTPGSTLYGGAFPPNPHHPRRGSSTYPAPNGAQYEYRPRSKSEGGGSNVPDRRRH